MPYSQRSLPKHQLSHRLDYNHETSTYQSNPQSSRLCQKFKTSLFRVRQLRSQSLTRTLDKDYNKYYINPEMRYKKKTQDPKKKILANAKESYFYDNLHNQEFWEWKHPLEKSFIHGERKSIQDKVNPKVLEKFREYVQSQSHSRLPLVVRSILEQKL